MELADSVVIVTGASRGIGRATAWALGESGARLGLVARDPQCLKDLEGKLRSAAVESLPLPIDLRDPGSAERIVEAVHDRFGRCDAAISCAGVARWGALLEQDPGDWREMLEVNLIAPLALAQAITRRYGAKHFRQLVHVSSVAALKPLTGNGVYAASKAALRVAGESLRQELASLGGALRLTTIVPGLVETDMTRQLGDSDAQRRVDELRAKFPFLEPSHVAEAVVWALQQPHEVVVNEIVLRPTRQPV
ncbi:MAG: SDR family oxidoreductase [Planctomycetota bacterium]